MRVARCASDGAAAQIDKHARSARSPVGLEHVAPVSRWRELRRPVAVTPGIPANEGMIRALAAWLDEAERLATTR